MLGPPVREKQGPFFAVPGVCGAARMPARGGRGGPGLVK